MSGKYGRQNQPQGFQQGFGGRFAQFAQRPRGPANPNFQPSPGSAMGPASAADIAAAQQQAMLTQRQTMLAGQASPMQDRPQQMQGQQQQQQMQMQADALRNMAGRIVPQTQGSV